MSRSYKKTPVYTDFSRFRTKYFKRKANHAIRRLKDIGNYNDYKKHYNGWNIHDWVSWWSKTEAIHDWEHPHWHYSSYSDEWWHVFSEYRTREEMEQYWAKYYKRK